tara:strand:+ start:111 stop:425 length:315 start_codon:yes stop_codon:yes gene_type:complete
MKEEEIAEALVNNKKFMENIRNSMEYRLGNYSHIHENIRRMVREDSLAFNVNFSKLVEKQFTEMIQTIILEDKNKNFTSLIRQVIIKELPSVLDMYFKVMVEDE